MADRILVKDAIVLTQDESLGELPRADVLVEGDTIAAVGPDLSAADAQVIDASGDIVIPGFIDTHRHTWETSIRTCAPDYTLGAYFETWTERHPRSERTNATNEHRIGRLVDVEVEGMALKDWPLRELRRRHALVLVDHSGTT